MDKADSDATFQFTNTRARYFVDSFVYLISEIEADDYVKIGISNWPLSRVCASLNPRGVRLVDFFPATKDVEQWLHARLANRKKRGEWFYDCDEVRAAWNETKAKCRKMFSTTRTAGALKDLRDACAHS